MIGSLIIFLSMFLSLARKIVISDLNETQFSQDMFAAVLVVLNGMMGTAAVLQVLIIGARVLRKAKKKRAAQVAKRSAKQAAPPSTTAERQFSNSSLTLERTVSTAPVAGHDIEQAVCTDDDVTAAAAAAAVAAQQQSTSSSGSDSEEQVVVGAPPAAAVQLSDDDHNADIDS
jgi:hypothetical protein